MTCMEAMTQERSSDDVFVWPDGTWCYRYERDEFHYMSDDYMVVFFGMLEYDEFFENLHKMNKFFQDIYDYKYRTKV